MTNAYHLAQVIARFSAFISFSPWETCAADLIRKHRPTSVYLFCKSFNDCPNKDFYRMMDMPWQTLLSGHEVRDLPNLAKTDMVFLVVHDDDFTWDNETVQYYRFAGRNDFKIIVVASMSDDQDRDLERIGNLFESMWASGVVNSVVLLNNNETTQMFTYIPFRSRLSCEDTSPVNLGECAGAIDRVFDLTYKILNLSKCPIRATLRDDRPFISYPVLGRYRKLIQEMEYRMNFSMETYVPADYKTGGPCGEEENKGIWGQVNQGKCHLAIGQFSERACSRLEYISISVMQCMAWCTPILPGKANVQHFLVGQFHHNVWAAYGLTSALVAVSVSILCFYAHEQASKTDAIRMALAVFSDIVLSQFRTDPVRIIVGIWLFACLVLRTAYECESQSRSTVPIGSHVVDNLDELAESEWRLCSTKVNIGALEDSSQPVVQKLYNNTQFCKGSVFELMEKSVQTQDTAYFMSDLRCGVTSSFLTGDRSTFNPRTGGCFKTYPVTPMITLPGSPFRQKWRDMFQRFVESGLLDKWLDIRPVRREKGTLKPYSLRHLVPPLFVLGIGCLVGTIAFLTEIAFYRSSCHSYNCKYPGC